MLDWRCEEDLAEEWFALGGDNDDLQDFGGVFDSNCWCEMCRMSKHYVESEDVQVCIVNAATSLDIDQMQIDYTGFTGPCLGGKSVMTTQTEVDVQDAQVQVDLGFTGCHLVSGDLITTQKVDSMQAAVQTDAGPSKRTLGRRLRKKRVEGRWKQQPGDQA